MEAEDGSGPAAFTERLWPSPGVWLMVPIGALIVLVAVLPVGVAPAVIVAGVVTAGLVAWAIQSAPVIQVRGGLLEAGRARVPVALLGDAVAARGEQARHERGPGLDARAFLCIRGWVDPVVRVELRDPADPTPYWLLSTRRPDELRRAIRDAGPSGHARAGDS